MRKTLLLLLLLTVPSFSLMLRHGIWTMHDFHLFRQYEFDKCIQEKVFPCRWSSNAGMGYGEPVFNFYGQFPYWVGQVFRTLGFQIIDSVKITFAVSLVLSAISMFFLARQFWGNLGGMVSGLFYVYAPYRAVDVWVRGALPESLAFVLFPLILFSLETKKYLLFSLLITILLITHNLSLFMFLPFLIIWWLARSRDVKFILITPVVLLLSSFYLLPVIFEKNLITLSQTTQSYYNYQLHWSTLKQLFVTRFWGYGGSVWGPNDTLSLSAGHLHWIVVTALALFLPLRLRGRIKEGVIFGLEFVLALFALFLTHGKSELIWKLVPGLPYVQFPWRFLSMSTFFLSIAAGSAISIIPKKFVSCLLLLLLLTNVYFFRPDIWRSITDSEQFSGALWDEQRSSALNDFWPIGAKLPSTFAPSHPSSALGEIIVWSKTDLEVLSPYAKVNFPVVYFPGWTGIVNGREQKVFPHGDLGLVTTRLPRGRHQVSLLFKDTFVRSLGNVISGAALLGIASWLIIRRKYV